MKIEGTFLRGRVARRAFVLFIISSLFPVAILALLSFRQVNDLISEQTRQQLRSAAKTYGLSLYDRLLVLDAQLGLYASAVRLRPEASESVSRSLSGFSSLVLVTRERTVGLFGDVMAVPVLTNVEWAYLRTGGTLLSSTKQPFSPPAHLPPLPSPLPQGARGLEEGGLNGYSTKESASPALFMRRVLDSSQPGSGVLVGRIDPTYLWGATETFDLRNTLCVLDHRGNNVFCSQPYAGEALNEVVTRVAGSASGQFAWKQGDENQLINYWSIFMKPRFFVPRWTVVLSRQRDDVLAPMADFRFVFVAVVLLSLFVVAFLATHQIRRNLIPLERLMEGIRRIAGNNFTQPVTVKSGDEFEELASSFNSMASRVARQLNALHTMAEIDRLILSRLKIEDIIWVVLTRTSDVVPCDLVSMAVIGEEGGQKARVHTGSEEARDGRIVEDVLLSSQDVQAALPERIMLITEDRADWPAYLRPLTKLGAKAFLSLPIVLHDELSAILSLGYQGCAEWTAEDMEQARDFGDRIAVALANAAWEEQLYHQAHYDVLTDLPNRLLLKDRLQQVLARAKRSRSTVAVLFLDLDRFKSVNDSLGHTAGDSLLNVVAGRLGEIIRQEDTVARLGGDEFIMVIPETEPGQPAAVPATRIAKRTLAVTSAPITLERHEVRVTASIGIAFYPEDGDSADQLLRNADAAMYSAKAKGKNTYQFYSAEFNAAALQRLEMENALHRAVERQEFVLFYQPKVETRSGKIVGAEALIRWEHPEEGFVSPGKFIPALEETGLILPVGEWILHNACAQAEAWRARGGPPLRIGVNLSAVQFRQKDLVDQVQAALRATGLEPAWLELEITEGAAMEDMARTLEVLNQSQGLGVCLSIDDFGTGYSSLSYLKHFPVHTLKIDQSFVRNLAREPKDAAIVKSTIALAHNLGLRVIAEGVEEEDQASFLLAHGCDQIQGYLCGRPLPAEHFTQLLEDGGLCARLQSLVRAKAPLRISE